MTDALPLSHSYNLARLGNAGDAVTFSADPEQLAAIARWSGVLSVEAFSVAVDIRKLGPVRFGLAGARWSRFRPIWNRVSAGNCISPAPPAIGPSGRRQRTANQRWI